jgi:hypothetical protein
MLASQLQLKAGDELWPGDDGYVCITEFGGHDGGVQLESV